MRRYRLHWFAMPLGFLLTLMSGPGAAQNALTNGGFDLGGPPTSFTGAFSESLSAAPAWGVWNNSFSTTTTELVESTDPFLGGGGLALHVVTGGADNGLFQFFAEQAPAFSSVDVLVTSGKMQLSLLGPGGYPTATFALAAGQWQHITFNLPQSNEIVLYSAEGAADFSVDNAWVGMQSAPIPEPTIAAMIGMAFLLGCAFSLRRTSRGRSAASY